MIGATWWWWAAMAVALSTARGVHGGFYVCPDACEALVLPRDMESIDDCLCPSSSLRSEYQEEEEEDDGMFQCVGRYKPREDEDDPRSVADCDCNLPYQKDSATGECHLCECPRAGNYQRKKASRQGVTSLADCDCTSPFVKDPPSGECVPAADNYECPPHSSAAMDPPQGDYRYPHRHRKRSKAPRSFADCHCDWGFVRLTTGKCEREKATYACPVYSARSPDLAPGEHPRGFFDCECDTNGYERNEQMQACVKIPSPDDEDTDEFMDDVEFECPAFSRPLAKFPHSIEQCACLPGYSWKLPEMTCVRASAYSCPAHAHFNPSRRGDGRSQLLAPAAFADCDCARGHVRDDNNGQCLAWFMRDGNSCPSFAVLTRWPLQNSANCECIYGFKNATATEVEDEDEYDDEEDKKPAKKECRSTPAGDKKQRQMPVCPARSFAVDWPIARVKDDCACLFGYERAPLYKKGDTEEDPNGFRCVQSEIIDLDEHAAKCRAPLVMNPLTGGCHYPVEDVKASVSTVDYTLGNNGDDDKVQDRDVIVLNGVEYDYVVADDSILVIQGDIAIGERLSWPTTDNQGENSHVLLHGYYNSERDHRWRDTTMCFQVDSSAKPMGRAVLDAMKHISTVTGFNFKRCKGDDCSVVNTDDVGGNGACVQDYINVKATQSSCFSYIGRIGGPQTLGVSTECGLGNIMHILLHAMGLRHAIDRPDRDQHVRIAWECIPEHKRSFFLVENEESAKKSTAGDDGADELASAFTNEPYDFYSIMHHPTSAFVHDEDTGGRRRPKWCQSIVPLIGDPSDRQAVMGLMGQRALLTVTDIHSVWRIYPSLQKGGAIPMPQAAASMHQPGQKSGLVVDIGKVHESKVHDELSTDVSASALSTSSKKTASPVRSFVKRVTSFLGAVAVLCGFGAFMIFAVMEARKRALAVRGGGDSYYAELLLADKGGLND